MWHELPEQRLAYIHQRQAELIAEAASNRLAPRRKAAVRNFSGIHLQFGDLLIVIGRTLCEDEALRRDAARS
jgi:hypothetical protein